MSNDFCVAFAIVPFREVSYGVLRTLYSYMDNYVRHEEASRVKTQESRAHLVTTMLVYYSSSRVVELTCGLSQRNTRTQLQ